MSKYALITDYLVRFLDDEVRKTGLKKVVLGLSGGTSFIKPAKAYLKLEIQLHRLRAQRKHTEHEELKVAAEMASISYHQLQLLGHKVVDRLRRAQRAKRTSQLNGN